MNINGKKFDVGFWHPFGPHGVKKDGSPETAEEIITRKSNEIKLNGWTLWSFQYRKTLGIWYQEISKLLPCNVFVFCSDSKSTKNPKGTCLACLFYTPINKNNRIQIPHRIYVPHPMGKKTRGSAFIVKNIIYPITFEEDKIEWFRARDEQWQQNGLYPTRPEYLIRAGSGPSLRKYRAVLELKAPYLAEICV